jgi:LysR substrate binding domain
MPGWNFAEMTFDQSAESFDNPDFVDVEIHAYRWVFGLEGGDPALQHLEERLAQKLPITVASADAASTRVAGPLRIAAPVTFARLYLAPLLTKFSRGYPDVRMTVLTSNEISE